jgi:hypothetical protein
MKDHASLEQPSGLPAHGAAHARVAEGRPRHPLLLLGIVLLILVTLAAMFASELAPHFGGQPERRADLPSPL